MFVTCKSFTDIQISYWLVMLFFASVQFPTVVTVTTPSWSKLATVYLLFISSPELRLTAIFPMVILRVKGND